MNNQHPTNLLQPPAVWNWYEKILFKFFFLFFTIFIIHYSIGLLPSFAASLVNQLCLFTDQLVPWVSTNLLHINYQFSQNGAGSGDTTYNYLLLLVFLGLSVIGCILWSVIDFRRKSYRSLYYWLTVIIRYYVAFTLLGYGLVKIFKSQFPSPDAGRLLQPYGESSPMGLAWTFLGFSDGYNILMGLAEVAALLLLFRRTLTGGLIITLFTTINIMAVNYFFDVPVKILSTALVAMTMFLVAHDARRLWIFFFTGRAVSLPVIYEPQSRQKWATPLKTCIKIAIICFTAYSVFKLAIDNQKSYKEYSAGSSINGVYEIERFSLNNKDIPPLRTDSIRWQLLYMRNRDRAAVRYMNDSLRQFKAIALPLSKVIYLTSPTGSGTSDTLHYESNKNGLYLLRGKIDQDSVAIQLKKVDISKFPLMKRGFNWINERPNNH